MSHNSRLIKFKRGLIGYECLLILTSVCALLTAQLARPHLGQFLTTHSSFKCQNVHGKRQCFEQSGLDWVTPARILQLPPSVVTSPHLSFTEEFTALLQPKGFHYNRPPPLS